MIETENVPFRWVNIARERSGARLTSLKITSSDVPNGDYIYAEDVISMVRYLAPELADRNELIIRKLLDKQEVRLTGEIGDV